MTSRSWYDLVTRTVTYNEERARSQMTDFVQQYHNPMRFEDASDQAEIDSQPFEHGGLIPTGKGVLGFTAALPNSPLCSTCAAMLDTPNSWQAPTASNEQQTRLSLTYQMLVDASTQGCHICFLQVQRLEAKHDRELLSKINYRDHYFWETKPGSGAFIGRPRTTQTHGIGITYFISSETTPETLGDGRGNSFVLTEAQDLDEDVGMNPFLPGGTVNTSGTWTLIRDWVRECESRHPICRQLKVRSRSLPTRLLKLPDGTYDRVSVVRTEGLPVDTKYITLSHRWGNAEFHAFVKSRPASYFENIDVAELPPIFRDILLVARQLEVSFIWIDAFCILQGSEEDWIRESARMGDVYRYSWCNIAASRAASSDESIFATRDSRAAKPCIVQTPWDPQASGAGKRWLAFDHNYLWEDNVERAPLAERAWVVQELALASRVVYFGCSQVFWECTQLRACETCPSGVPIVATKKLSLHPSCLQFEGLRVFDPADYRLHIWSLLISKYSACLLTETAKDKLVALSGLAKSLGPSHEYCAGLWRKDLAYQLLWKSLRPSTSRRAPVTPAEYQAPSWSWASVNGPISYRIRESVNDPEAEILITVLDVETEKAGSDPTGRVKGGSIVISGPIVKASLGVRQVGTINYHVVNGALGKGIIDGDPLPDTNEHYCMPVEVKTRKGEGHTLVVGLILTRSVVNANALQRMAYFTLSDHEDRKNEGETMFGFWKSFRDPARRPDEALARESRTPRTAAAVVFGLPIYEFTIV